MVTRCWRQFPHTGFECLIGENDDVIDLLQKGRAQVGLIEAREDYPTDIDAYSKLDGRLCSGHVSAGVTDEPTVGATAYMA